MAPIFSEKKLTITTKIKGKRKKIARCWIGFPIKRKGPCCFIQVSAHPHHQDKKKPIGPSTKRKSFQYEFVISVFQLCHFVLYLTISKNNIEWKIYGKTMSLIRGKKSFRMFCFIPKNKIEEKNSFFSLLFFILLNKKFFFLVNEIVIDCDCLEEKWQLIGRDLILTSELVSPESSSFC